VGGDPPFLKQNSGEKSKMALKNEVLFEKRTGRNLNKERKRRGGNCWWSAEGLHSATRGKLGGQKGGQVRGEKCGGDGIAPSR